MLDTDADEEETGALLEEAVAEEDAGCAEVVPTDDDAPAADDDAAAVEDAVAELDTPLPGVLVAPDVNPRDEAVPCELGGRESDADVALAAPDDAPELCVAEDELPAAEWGPLLDADVLAPLATPLLPPPVPSTRRHSDSAHSYPAPQSAESVHSASVRHVGQPARGSTNPHTRHARRAVSL
ncbi:MAG: hypothetical protein HY904_11675 [Deltaproteobacteria bacterium]|nr:hypothetical protein [Deltaproteobacteria bacterium]